MENSLIGGLYLVLLFALSFAAVYITKIVYLLFLHLKPKTLLAAQETQKPKRESPEKIYYIVERKKAPVRKVKSEPKRIYFSENKAE